MTPSVLLIACGALAKELVQLQRHNQWSHIKIQCLPAELHNRPEKIPARVRETIEKYQGEYQHIFVAYADCGTGGLLDAVLDEYGLDRLPGAHCYEFFAGGDVFANLAEQEPGTYYLTDFLVRHFDRLVKNGLGLDKHPELMSAYFGNYRKLVYLAQTESDELTERARSQAAFLGLTFEKLQTGLEPVERNLAEHIIQWQS